MFPPWFFRSLIIALVVGTQGTLVNAGLLVPGPDGLWHELVILAKTTEPAACQREAPSQSQPADPRHESNLQSHIPSQGIATHDLPPPTFTGALLGWVSPLVGAEVSVPILHAGRIRRPSHHLEKIYRPPRAEADSCCCVRVFL